METCTWRLCNFSYIGLHTHTHTQHWQADTLRVRAPIPQTCSLACGWCDTSSAPAVMPRDESQWRQWHTYTHVCSHTRAHTHIKHGSGDLCRADLSRARWPLDDEWQAALPSLLLSFTASFHFSITRHAGVPRSVYPAHTDRLCKDISSFSSAANSAPLPQLRLA